MICLLSFIPLLYAQGTINDINLKSAPSAEQNKNFSVKNILVIIIGGIFLLFSVAGSLIPSSLYNENGQQVWEKLNTFEHQANQEEGISDSAPGVIIYTTPQCGFCNLAKSFFSKHNIDYSEYDITSSQRGFQEYRELKGQGVPLIFVGDTRLDGYNEQFLRSALEKEGLL